MVDSHQALTDNCNGNSAPRTTSIPNSSENVILMNERVTQQDNNLNGNGSLSAVETICEKNGESSSDKLDNQDEIKCGSSPIREYTDITVNSKSENPNFTNTIQANTVAGYGETSHLIITDLSSTNVSANDEFSIVNSPRQTSQPNYLCQQSRKTTASVPIDSDRIHKNSIEFQSTESSITNKMESRKVEPIRININRDPIKTKIKLGPSHDCQTMSPKSSSSNYLSSSSSASHEAIPKLKIKKVDLSSTTANQTTKPILGTALSSDEITCNYQTHLLSEFSTTVPT